METKQMYALTFCYEGYENNIPTATTIAVSDSMQRLQEEMARCVEEDTRVDEEDEWCDDCNFIVMENYGHYVKLRHTHRTELYQTYIITSVKYV
jgi:hypothetical protein